jgi:hypothetical protein
MDWRCVRGGGGGGVARVDVVPVVLPTSVAVVPELVLELSHPVSATSRLEELADLLST